MGGTSPQEETGHPPAGCIIGLGGERIIILIMVTLLSGGDGDDGVGAGNGGGCIIGLGG